VEKAALAVPTCNGPCAPWIRRWKIRPTTARLNKRHWSRASIWPPFLVARARNLSA